MAKEKSVDKEGKRREKHAKKEKRSEKDGVHKSKKVKKDKTSRPTAAAADAAAKEKDGTTKLMDTLEDQKPGSVVIKEDGDSQVKVKTAPLLGALVPFANPLADEKTQKKVLKGVKKGILLPPLLP